MKQRGIPDPRNMKAAKREIERAEKSQREERTDGDGRTESAGKEGGPSLSATDGRNHKQDLVRLQENFALLDGRCVGGVKGIGGLLCTPHMDGNKICIFFGMCHGIGGDEVKTGRGAEAIWRISWRTEIMGARQSIW